MACVRIWCLAAAIAVSPVAAQTSSHSTSALPNGGYIATAYDQSGITASGLYTHRHIVAADPDILPIGSIIRIRHAGRYSGEYVVADTGQKIVGRKLDIYIPDLAACKKFGVRRVKVRVIQLGNNTHESAKVADREVKQDVQQDLQNPAPTGAASADDHAAKAQPSSAAPSAPRASGAKSNNPSK